MKKLIMASVLLLAATGCSSAATNQAATSSPLAAATAKPAAAPLDSVNKMIETSQKLSDQLQARKDAEIKEEAHELHEIWETFEDGIKEKNPEFYTKVEKSLNPLDAGAKQDKLDYDALTRLNGELAATLGELSSILKK